MPKYWVKNYFAHGRFPEVGQKQKTEKKERERERERERKLVITMASYALRTPPRVAHAKPPGPKKKEQTMVITIAKLRMAHASTHGAAWAKIP